MKVLIGTTNPAKVKRFADILEGCGMEFVTLRDMGIDSEPDENGGDPEENAIIKVCWYGQFADYVICNDSGLYFDGMPLDDPRQPGLNIRTPGGGPRLDDEAMIEYYSALVNSLGGSIEAFYLDGIAVCSRGKVFSFMENSEATRASAFVMVDQPSEKRHPGWPLDSISVNRSTGQYFVDNCDNKYDKQKENVILGGYRRRLREFLIAALNAE